MIDILPDPMIDMGCHGLVKMTPLDGLNGCDDFASPETKRCRSSQSGTGDIELLSRRENSLDRPMS
jgi:hypothetical protein